MPRRKSTNTPITVNERRTLEVEYGIAFEIFKLQNSQAWQTFQIVSALALASLAFIGQLKSNVKVTWPASIAVGSGMIAILAGWFALASRWWAYAAVELHRMREIETRLGMFLFREGEWLRKPLRDVEIKSLDSEARIRHNELRKAFPTFPKHRWRQKVLSTIIVGILVLIWTLFMIADVLGLI